MKNISIVRFALCAVVLAGAVACSHPEPAVTSTTTTRQSSTTTELPPTPASTSQTTTAVRQ